jgi:hypothetical protein
MGLPSDDRTQSTPEIHRDLVNVVREAVLRSQTLAPPGLGLGDYDRLVRTLSNVHQMILYDRSSWTFADSPLQMRLSQIDHVLTTVVATATAIGETAVLVNGGAQGFSSPSFHSAGWRVSAGLRTHVVRAFWDGASVEMTLNATGIKRANVSRAVTSSDTAAEEEGAQEEGGEGAGRRLLRREPAHISVGRKGVVAAGIKGRGEWAGGEGSRGAIGGGKEWKWGTILRQAEGGATEEEGAAANLPTPAAKGYI